MKHEQLSFFDTINSSSSELIQHEAKAYTQEQKVLNYFQSVKRSTALQAAVKLGMHESSCRRSVTNLAKKGLLRKTAEQIIDKYGKKNFIYQIV